jgi:hypothetical protein
MKSIFNNVIKDELINRINSLTEDSQSQWGNMNVFQMVKHCRIWDEMMQGEENLKQTLVGKIFGRIALKAVLGNDKPLRQSTPTAPILTIKEITGNFNEERALWISSIEKYCTYHNPQFRHVFFGKMTREQVGQMAYKHIDHHLRQFNG